MTRTMAVGEEEVLRLREPPVVRLVGGIDVVHGEVPEAPERLLEHVHTLALVVRRLHEARDKRGVALGRAFLEEAHLVAPIERNIRVSRDGYCSERHIHNPRPGAAGVVNGGVGPVVLSGVVGAQA